MIFELHAAAKIIINRNMCVKDKTPNGLGFDLNGITMIWQTDILMNYLFIDKTNTNMPILRTQNDRYEELFINMEGILFVSTKANNTKDRP